MYVHVCMYDMYVYVSLDLSNFKFVQHFEDILIEKADPMIVHADKHAWNSLCSTFSVTSMHKRTLEFSVSQSVSYSFIYGTLNTQYRLFYEVFELILSSWLSSGPLIKCLTLVPLVYIQSGQTNFHCLCKTNKYIHQWFMLICLSAIVQHFWEQNNHQCVLSQLFIIWIFKGWISDEYRFLSFKKFISIFSRKPMVFGG